MMSAKFFFYPQPTANHLVTIDLGEDLAEFYSDYEYTAGTSESMSGKIHQTTMLNREVITIVRDRMQGSETLAHKLLALQNHLDRGFSCAFAADHTKAFCHPLSRLPVGGADTSVRCHGNPFRSMVGSHSPAANDFFVVESQPPRMLQEAHKVQSVSGSYSVSSGGDIFTVDKINFTYSSPAFMRHFRFFPVLKRLPADRGKSIVTNEHGLLYSLEIRLTPDYENYFAFHPNQESDVPSGLLADGIIVGNAEVFDRPTVNLDNPPGQQSLDANVDISSNLAWNNWRNYGN
jgi:hypothetical protein